jgi:hypothetical protein
LKKTRAAEIVATLPTGRSQSGSPEPKFVPNPPPIYLKGCAPRAGESINENVDFFSWLAHTKAGFLEGIMAKRAASLAVSSSVLSTTPIALEICFEKAAIALLEQKEGHRFPVLLHSNRLVEERGRIPELERMGAEAAAFLKKGRSCVMLRPRSPESLFGEYEHHRLPLFILPHGDELSPDFQRTFLEHSYATVAPIIIMIETHPEVLVSEGRWSVKFRRFCANSVIH